MRSNKGFTLIELLAVIVILAIISLIATPMVLNTIDDARKGAAQSSAYTYINEVEKQIALDMMNTQGKAPTLITDPKFATVKGDAPTSVTLNLENGVIKSGTFVINGYTIAYDGKTATVTNAAAEPDAGA